jgi:hypothetical protein
MGKGRLMALITSTKSTKDNEESSRGGPIGALLIAIPVSFLIWGAAVFVLLNLVH